jgi:hypothetical protein
MRAMNCLSARWLSGLLVSYREYFDAILLPSHGEGLRVGPEEPETNGKMNHTFWIAWIPFSILRMVS